MAADDLRPRRGRPPGSRNRRSLDLEHLVRALVAKGRLRPGLVLQRLEELALSDAADRVAAARVLLSYLYPRPSAPAVNVNVSTVSPIEILAEIARERRSRDLVAARPAAIEPGAPSGTEPPSPKR